MTPSPYDLASEAVPDDALALSADDLSLEQARTPAMDGGKAAASASLSPDQYAREETVPRSARDASPPAEEP
jgi:hypothetical protein